MTTRPRVPAASMAACTMPVEPTHSNTTSKSCGGGSEVGSCAPVAPNTPATSRRAAIGSLTTTSRAPRRCAHMVTASPMFPPPSTSTLSPALMVSHGHGVQADGERLDQRAEPAEGRVQRDRLRGGDPDVFGERARGGAHPEQIDARTVRGLVGQAPAARPARGQRQGGGVLALAPLPAAVGPDGDDLSAELVTQHRTGRQHRVRLQVRTADPARVHAQRRVRRARATDRGRRRPRRCGSRSGRQHASVSLRIF